MPEAETFYCQNCEAFISGQIIGQGRINILVATADGRAHSVIRGKKTRKLTPFERTRQKRAAEGALEEAAERAADSKRYEDWRTRFAAANAADESGADIDRDVIEVSDATISQDCEIPVEDKSENTNSRLDDYFRRKDIGQRQSV